MPGDKAAVGARLRKAREERGWSRDALAARFRSAGDKLPGVVSLAHMVKEWEAGKHGVSDRYQVLYCRVFGVPRAELFGEPVAPSAQQAVALADDAVDHGRLAYALKHPQRIDKGAVEALAAMLAAQRRLEDIIGAQAVLPAVNGTLTIAQHLVHQARGSVRASVLDVSAQWAQFAGWLNTTTRRHLAARKIQNLFLTWAVETGNADLTATALNVKGHLAWTLDDYRTMGNLSDAAARYKQASPAVLASAAQQRARAHALLGEADEAERRLDEADDLAVRAVEQPDGIPSWMYFHSTDLLVLQRGLAYQYLAAADQPGYHRKAIDHLTSGLDGLDEETRNSEWISWYADQLERLHQQATP